MASTTHRTQFSMPRVLHRQLKNAILRRAALAAGGNKKGPPATLSGWIQEQAIKFIRSQT